MAEFDRLFTHPVLSPYNDDYNECRFSIELKVRNELRQSIIQVELKLDCDDLQRLIDDGKAAFCVRIACPITNLRESMTTKETHIERVIDSDRLNGSVQIEAFIVAMQDISDYTSTSLNEDYEGMRSDLSKGNILALAETYTFEVSKLNEDIENHPPVFTVQLAEGKPDNSPIEVEVGDQIIAIRLCKKLHEDFRMLNSQPNMRNVIFSALVIPAFMTALERLCEEDGYEEYSEYRWFKVIKKVLGDSVEFTEDRIDLKGHSLFELAQLTLANPIGKAFSILTDIEYTEGE